MRKDGYRTAIGTAEFHDSKLNMTSVKNKSKVGRPKNVSKILYYSGMTDIPNKCYKHITGRPGRPCTTHSAAKAAQLKALRNKCGKKEESKVSLL